MTLTSPTSCITYLTWTSLLISISKDPKFKGIYLSKHTHSVILGKISYSHKIISSNTIYSFFFFFFLELNCNSVLNYFPLTRITYVTEYCHYALRLFFCNTCGRASIPLFFIFQVLPLFCITHQIFFFLFCYYLSSFFGFSNLGEYMSISLTRNRYFVLNLSIS